MQNLASNFVMTPSILSTSLDFGSVSVAIGWHTEVFRGLVMVVYLLEIWHSSYKNLFQINFVLNVYVLWPKKVVDSLILIRVDKKRTQFFFQIVLTCMQFVNVSKHLHNNDHSAIFFFFVRTYSVIRVILWFVEFSYTKYRIFKIKHQIVQHITYEDIFALPAQGQLIMTSTIEMNFS